MYRQTFETYNLDFWHLLWTKCQKNGGERAILAVFRQHVGDLALKTALLCARSSTTNTHDSVALQTRRRHLGEQIGPDNVIVIDLYKKNCRKDARRTCRRVGCEPSLFLLKLAALRAGASGVGLRLSDLLQEPALEIFGGDRLQLTRRLRRAFGGCAWGGRG